MGTDKTQSYILVILYVLMVSLLVFMNCSCTNHIKTPNCLLIVSDALRFDVLGCYGGPAETPHIDLLAQNGVLFDNAYSTSPKTLPSAVAMFTGNFSSTYLELIVDRKIIKYFVPQKEKLFGEVLKELHYEVRMDIENPVALRSNNLQGFDDFKWFNLYSRTEKKKVMDTTRIIIRKNRYKRMFGILEYLLKVQKNQKFFVLKWILDPHSYYNPPNIFRTKIIVDPNMLSKPLKYYSSCHFGNKSVRDRMNPRNLSEYELKYIKKLYIKEVESVDERVGYIINALKANNLLDKTMIIFTSDHGEAFGEHNGYGHGFSYYEELLHVPLIISGPGIPKKKRIKNVVNHLNLMPTMMDLMGIKFRGDVQGKSYSDLLKNKPMKKRIHYFIGAYISGPYQDAIMQGYYKLITRKNPKKFKFFNLETDPDELVNIPIKRNTLHKKMLSKIYRIRNENKQRKKRNILKLNSSDKLSEKDRKKIISNLKTLGYI